MYIYDRMINLLVVVLSCAKNKKLWQKIIDRGVPNLIILCGGAEETRLEHNVLHLKCCDAYEGLPEKMICAINFIVKSEKFKEITHILKADDYDTIFTKNQIEYICSKYDNFLNINDYVGQNLISGQGDRKYHYGKVSKGCVWDNKPYTGIYNPWLGGGETYILSRLAMMFIAAEVNNVESYGPFEDLMMANILIKHDIHPRQLKYGIRTWIGTLNLDA